MALASSCYPKVVPSEPTLAIIIKLSVKLSHQIKQSQTYILSSPLLHSYSRPFMYLSILGQIPVILCIHQHVTTTKAVVAPSDADCHSSLPSYLAPSLSQSSNVASGRDHCHHQANQSPETSLGPVSSQIQCRLAGVCIPTSDFLSACSAPPQLTPLYRPIRRHHILFTIVMNPVQPPRVHQYLIDIHTLEAGFQSKDNCPFFTATTVSPPLRL
jgi:hypothetical protein